MLRPSVCLSHHATVAPTCGGFAAERREYITNDAAALVTARHSAANANSVTLTAKRDLCMTGKIWLIYG